MQIHPEIMLISWDRREMMRLSRHLKLGTETGQRMKHKWKIRTIVIAVKLALQPTKHSICIHSQPKPTMSGSICVRDDFQTSPYDSKNLKDL